MVLLATGSDYGGSLRTPAGFCGVTGFRPSPGMVPTVESSITLNPFSVFGPMGKDVRDTYMLFESIIDFNTSDIFSSVNSFSQTDYLIGSDLSSIKVAYSSDLGCAPVDKNIKEICKELLVNKELNYYLLNFYIKDLETLL